MSQIFILFSFFYSSVLFANFNFKIKDICSNANIVNEIVKTENVALGDFMINFLDAKKIPYKGSRFGINSIKNSPIGDDALAVISDTELLAFGWCYKVNNEISEKMPDEVQVNSNTKSIEWFFGFAHYLNGEWISQCEENKLFVKKYICSKLN